MNEDNLYYVDMAEGLVTTRGVVKAENLAGVFEYIKAEYPHANVTSIELSMRKML